MQENMLSWLLKVPKVKEIVVVGSSSRRRCRRRSGDDISIIHGWLVGELISYGYDNLFSKLVSVLDNHLDRCLIRYRLIGCNLISIIILSLIIRIIINTPL